MDEITPRQTEILAWICARMAEDRLCHRPVLN